MYGIPINTAQELAEEANIKISWNLQPSPVTPSPVTPYQDSQCSSRLAISSRYDPQQAIDIAYQPDRNYIEVDFDKLVNQSFMDEYNRKFVSFYALFGSISDNFWVYGQANQVSQAEKSQYFLAIIISPRSLRQHGILIDKDKINNILNISSYAKVKIEGYAIVRRDKYGVLEVTGNNVLIKVDRIQVICDVKPLSQ